MSAPKTWESIINDEREKEYFQNVLTFVEQQRNSGKTVYPPQDQVFSAFDMTPFESVRVVILGQDPYHGANQAHGLAFSVLPGVKIPPSLRNMYKELAQDIKGFEAPSHGFLESWASQGVLMLNTVLTVEEAKAHSHAKCGWESFTDAIIAELNQRSEPIIFLLWGAHAQKKGQVIDAKKHHVLVAPHPSPLSARRGFFGCQHFSTTNQLLSSIDQQPIDWRLPTEL
ncbi:MULTISPECIES: uracil-DNA glycosylase [Vibrio]|uniref:Uracil-DNA glycosylase n=3 Tax=Vibrio cyclitrophicus TaxID=47951 RepID=A0A7Z1S0I0_9VIBR|nr:uracil-DNA glycosylase [Vibrio cyclitrophicus]KAA8599740.1 Uracil-DNA glycosylase family 1 [Vibrio cyclitrophicus]MBU2933738.1 uracil-DNA glycosylase [Vibrio cyclitrophicus]NOH20288.1 uracil-DNA glycosylase [Vibrio cyclitrophicus]NOI33633.1 uracil-DNA glycosylase [Vibrio cyclitrophicus]OBS92856.1 uracil-DNA glycosylase [Vibrio cyclitrophicus]|tara:strand:+ start:126 stop:806 length:681 start_codon:yes stop_codon:yes gene_type:complete